MLSFALGLATGVVLTLILVVAGAVLVVRRMYPSTAPAPTGAQSKAVMGVHRLDAKQVAALTAGASGAPAVSDQPINFAQERLRRRPNQRALSERRSRTLEKRNARSRFASPLDEHQRT